MCFQRKRGLPSSRLTKAGQISVEHLPEFFLRHLRANCVSNEKTVASVIRAVCKLHQ
ncbi:hypothetical protein HMPREF1584_00816 [Gardnerella vaginalis JCP8481A]|nr:hypothetical protein HMPREF1584_00816 [Gardnerella vaginalis JCP8481A]